MQKKALMAEIHYYDNKLSTLPLTKRNLNRVKNKRLWIDLQRPNDKDIELVKRKFKLHPTTVEDIKSHNTRIKVEEFRYYLFIVMYDISERNSELHHNEIDIIIGRDFIITIHPQKLEELQEELDQLKVNNKKLTNHFILGTDRILHDIIDKVTAHYFPIMDRLNDEIDELEETIAENVDKKTLARIINLRKKTVIIKKILNPQKEKISFLAKTKHKFINEESMPYFRDLNDDVIRLAEMNDSFRETINSVYETYMSSISYNMNEIIKILSIISTIMLPLTFITGIFGMNFNYMPWVRDHMGFWFSIAIMVIIGVGMMIFFQKKRWF